MENPDQGFVSIAVGILLSGKGEEAALAHLPDIRELLVDVAVGEGGDFFLVRLAHGLIVIEIRVPPDEDMVDPRAEEARNRHLKELGKLIGYEGEEPINE